MRCSRFLFRDFFIPRLFSECDLLIAINCCECFSLNFFLFFVEMMISVNFSWALWFVFCFLFALVFPCCLNFFFWKKRNEMRRDGEEKCLTMIILGNSSHDLHFSAFKCEHEIYVCGFYFFFKEIFKQLIRDSVFM